MAISPSDRLLRQVHRLFHLGAVGTMSDPQLLDQVVSRRDEAAEAAFEELVIRHGPMVLRVCRSVLHNAHDAEDAFQAVFLVLANRAGSIRRSGSVASWLFGVAQRVATRARRSAARRHALNQRVAGQASESYLPAERDPDWEFLHEEVNGLPEHLRAPIVLCYLQGLTYDAAAHQLGLSETAVRGRLARARERLRRRLTRRGVTVPAGLFVAGAAGQAQVAIPVTLIHSTSRIALGFMAGNTAAVLARGVLNSMLLNRLTLTTVLVCLGLGGSYWTWHALATVAHESGQPDPRPAVARISGASQPPRTDRYGDPLPPGAAMRLGTIRFRQFPHIGHIAYSPDDQLVLTDTQENFLQVWDARDGRKLRQIDAGVEQVHDFALSPDRTLIAVEGVGFAPKRNLAVWQLTFIEVATGRTIRRGEWDMRSAEDELAYSPDGKTVATESDDGTFRLWDVATAKLLYEERLGGRQNHASIAFSPRAASHLLAIASDRVIRLWDAAQLRDVRTIAIEGEHPPTGLAFSPDGSTLAAGMKTDEAEIRLWRVSDGTLVRRFQSPKGQSVYQVLFSPDGKLLAATGPGRPLVLFAAGNGMELGAFGKEFDLLAGTFSSDSPMAFSPDGRTLATTGGREALHYWDLATGKDRLATPEAHLGGVYALAFPADGKTLISGSDDRTVRVWDLATGRPTKVLAHDGWVRSLAVSADGSFLAAGVAYPKNVHLWNLKTGERLHTWPVASEILRDVTLGGDGSSAIVTMRDGSLLGWDLSTGKERLIDQPNQKKPVDPAVAAALPLVPPDLSVFSLDGQSKATVRFSPGKPIMLADGNSRQDPSTVASTIVWLDARTGHVRREIEIPQSRVQLMAFSPDEQFIAVGTFSSYYPPARGIIHIFRLRDKKEIQTIEAPCAWIDALGFTPDGKQIVAGLQDTSIVIWDVRPID